jgi:outer membrane lipoprotein
VRLCVAAGRHGRRAGHRGIAVRCRRRTDNRETQTEVTVLAYPLDAAQRPVPAAGTRGRFIIVLPGYVERHDYPDGLFVTLIGRLAGSRAGQVGEHAYVFPLVEAAHVHRWPPGFQFDRPQWHFGVGVGISIH